MFIAALVTITKTQEQPKCPVTNEWIQKIWQVYTREYYSAIERNEIVMHATPWLNSENIILSEISQTEKYKFSCTYTRDHPEVLTQLVWGRPETLHS